MAIDWDEIEEAVVAYGDLVWRMAKGYPNDGYEGDGLDETMVKIHNAVREGTRDVRGT